MSVHPIRTDAPPAAPAPSDRTGGRLTGEEQALVYEGLTPQDALERFNENQENYLDMGHMKAIILGAFIMIIGVIIQVVIKKGEGNPVGQIIAGRIVMGIGNGINTSTIPTYQGWCLRFYH